MTNKNVAWIYTSISNVGQNILWNQIEEKTKMTSRIHLNHLQIKVEKSMGPNRIKVAKRHV
jgi:hypothetical protein